jgi:carbon-monoxide dehydrogenase iron sulfur subunit
MPMKTVFVRPERCIGCRQCEIACAVEHSRSKDLAAAVTEQPPPKARVRVEAGLAPGTAFPNRCRHCDPAPCLMVCPTGAIARDPAQGLVLVDTARCIACAMCAIVCPFAAVAFHPTGAREDDPAHALVAIKCDGCIDRVRVGRVPACAEVCMVGALVYGELNELVAEERAGLTARTLAAAAAASPESDLPPGVAAWRGFGIDLKDLQRRAS